MADGRGFGLTSPDWLGSFILCGYSRRMLRRLGMRGGGFTPSSTTWPASGMMRNGECFRLETLERHTKEPAYGWLPTPTATANQTSPSMLKHPSCRAFVRLFGDGPIHPEVYEWLMGFPTGWTDLDPSETP